jgi:hypothetical protein
VLNYLLLSDTLQISDPKNEIKMATEVNFFSSSHGIMSGNYVINIINASAVQCSAVQCMVKSQRQLKFYYF